MMVKREKIWLANLIVYIFIVFYFAVMNRESGTSNTIKLDLFWGYNELKDYVIRDKLINIAFFIPIGLLTGLVFKKNCMLKTMLIGLLVSLVIECSQLLMRRGVFDVDDIFNNTVGALVGGAIVVLIDEIRLSKECKVNRQ